MMLTKSEYEKRKQEVSKYFDAVRWLDRGGCRIVCTNILGNDESMPIDDELSKILKANSFILLYNLIESSITNSIKAIVNSIENDGLTYEQLSKNIKHLWMRQETRKLKTGSDPIELVSNIAQSIIQRQLLVLRADSINISGNIDAREIRKIASQIGWEVSKNGRELEIIKNKRNSLAHGEFTFSAVGKDFTIKDLISLKEKTIEYLDDVLSKVETYINNQKYKKQ